MYSITEYQYQQLRNRYPNDEVIRDEIPRQSLKGEAQPQADNTAMRKLLCDIKNIATTNKYLPADAVSICDKVDAVLAQLS